MLRGSQRVWFCKMTALQFATLKMRKCSRIRSVNMGIQLLAKSLNTSPKIKYFAKFRYRLTQ